MNLPEGPIAIFAREWHRSSMNIFVHLHRLLIGKTLPAEATREYLLSLQGNQGFLVETN